MDHHPDLTEDTYLEDAQRMIVGQVTFYVTVIVLLGLAIRTPKRWLF